MYWPAIFPQHPKYGYGTVALEKNVAGNFMMRVNNYEQSVETFSTLSTAFESEREINQSELDVHSNVWSDNIFGQT